MNNFCKRKIALKELFPNQIVDVFLSSLAEAKGKNSITVILSGCGNDGAKGCIQIKAAGGMVIVQDPSSCEMGIMPLSAIETNTVDHIMLPADMPKIILQHVEYVLKNSGTVQNLRSETVLKTCYGYKRNALPFLLVYQLFISCF